MAGESDDLPGERAGQRGTAGSPQRRFQSPG